MSSEIQKVISGGYCIGCGGCTLGREDSGMRIELDALGRYQARIAGVSEDAWSRLDQVCPFSNSAADEDELATGIHEAPGLRTESHLGRFLEVLAGHVAEAGFRGQGSSGGFTSWILAELLRRGMVDAVIHVKPRHPDPTDPAMFRYEVSRTIEELRQGAKSHYYPVEMSGILEVIRATPGRYALVGVPCFIKAIRLLARQEPVFRERVKFSIGLFCGHLKSTGFAELLAWQAGVKPDQLRSIDFRTKIPDRPASQYGITVTGTADGEPIVRTAAMADLIGADWGMGFFKYKACDFCDDISAETADVSVGDAWLPQFVSDSQGTNVIVIRNIQIKALVDEGMESGRLRFAPLAVDQAVESQNANVRHRRQGLAYRLHLLDLTKEWRPRKRVDPAPMEDKRRAAVLEQRIRFREVVPLLWSDAVARGSLESFLKSVGLLIQDYKDFRPRPQLLRRGLKHRLKKFVKSCLGR